MNYTELIAALRREHLVVEGISQNARLEDLITAYGDTCVLNAKAELNQEQALIDARRPTIAELEAIFRWQEPILPSGQVVVPEGAIPDA